MAASPRSISEELIPLHSIEAEMSALGSMLYGERHADQVIGILDESEFYRPAHREIFRAMLQLQQDNKAIDLVTLKQELVQRGKLEEVGGEEYLIRIAEFVPSPANAQHYANIVREHATLRRLEEAGHEIVKVVRDPELDTDEKVSTAERYVYEIGARHLGKDFVPMQSLARDVMLEIDTIVDTGQESVGITTGFADLNDLTTGFYPGDLVIVAARPSMGKTSLVLKMAYEIARRHRDKAVAFFSLEMGSIQLARRLVSMFSRVNSNEMRKPNLSPDAIQRLADACETLYSLPIYIDETANISGFEMLGKCRRLQREHGLSLVVVDYLQLMRSNRRTENRVTEVSEIARSLKALAKELQVPVIALSQLSRSVEQRENKRPQLSDLRESGSIEAEADMVMFIYREAYYKSRENPEEADDDPDRVEVSEISLAKHRNGPTGVVKLAFQPTFALFSDLRH
ncbi:MAG: replicative DNA helicase [Fimbriimonadaceae bacterium]